MTTVMQVTVRMTTMKVLLHDGIDDAAAHDDGPDCFDDFDDFAAPAAAAASAASAAAAASAASAAAAGVVVDVVVVFDD